MGQAKKKKERFLQNHPSCCFCGGEAAATTIDHVPSRDCFKGRAFPETFEFPACENCQNSSRSDEQIFSFVVQMVDRNSTNYDSEKARRAISGIRNNFPDLMPEMIDDPRAKFDALRHLGHPTPVLSPAEKIPIVALPEGVGPYLQRAVTKIAMAIYYRERGQIVPLSHYAFSLWSFSSDLNAMENIAEVAQMARFSTQGWRSNLDFGDQFGYRWHTSVDADEHDLFMVVGQFGLGLVFVVLLVDQDGAQEVVDEEWFQLRTLYRREVE